MRLVQLFHSVKGRKVGLVEEPYLKLLDGTDSVYNLVLSCFESNVDIFSHVNSSVGSEQLNYTEVYNGKSSWRLLPSFDCPSNQFNCILSGTGLTHHASAINRQQMHQLTDKELTESMKIYQLGAEGGRPAPGESGAQPEWFYKGTGHNLRGHQQSLDLPPYGDDGGEEPEIAGVYMIDREGSPFRIGFTTANEYSDHIMEKQNYLYLAHSKLRECAIGPELVLDNEFQQVRGQAVIKRGDKVIWSKKIQTGESNMVHSLQNIEYHHFKYSIHRIPFQAHIHFFGVDSFSFGDNISLQSGDEMEICWEGFGRSLINRLEVRSGKEKPIIIRSFSK